jgi:uncharacterized protein YcfL
MRIYFCSLALVLACLLGGCKSREVAIIDSRKMPAPKIEGELEAGLVATISNAQHDGNLLYVTAEIHNERSSTARFEYRYLWFDNQGRLFDTPTSRWLLKSLDGNDTAICPGVAPHSSVSDYVLKIRSHK